MRASPLLIASFAPKLWLCVYRARGPLLTPLCLRLRRKTDLNTASTSSGMTIGPSLYKASGQGGVTVHYFGHQT